MKPISLKLSGLQSYREMQEIDFSALCDIGLFGIFGPTGSGKSTILDAITLAMYGKVGRALSGTQGIMNHSEDTLFVSFTFELMSAQGVERYRIERRFKRKNEISVSNTISRFIEILPEGEKVVADKLDDVTRCVEDKIGLKMDDFTRAVVLPQGKFAEFLSLRGADRRAMLQRLFHLEKYGDLLGQKLARKVKETEQLLKELKAEQQGLGNASEEALRAATAAVQAAAELAAARRRELGAAQQRADELAKVRELGLERARRAAQLDALREQSGAVAALESRLAHAVAAEAIRPSLAAWKEAQQRAAERAALAAGAQRAALEAEAAASKASAEAEAAAAALSRGEPALLVRLEQLEQARSLQAECALLQSELQELQSRREAGERRREALQAETGKEEALLAKAQARQQELELQLKGNEVKASERQRIQEAVQRQQRLAALREQLVKAEAEEAEQRTKASEAAAGLTDAASRSEEAEGACGKLAADARDAIQSLMGMETDLNRFGDMLLQYETSLRQTLRERERHVWSVRLAENLRQGESCPVCGSVHHPDPVQPEEEKTSGSEADLEAAASLLAEIREQRFKISRDIEICRGVLELLGSSEEATAHHEITAALHRTAAAAEAAEAVHSRYSSVADFAAPDEVRLTVNHLLAEYSSWRLRIEALQREVRAAQAELGSRRSITASAEAAAATASGLFEQASSRARQSREQMDALLLEWQREHPDLSPEEAVERMEEFGEKDRITEDIKQRLELSIPFIEDKSARLAVLGREMTELEKELLQREVQVQGKEELLREKRDRLTSWVGESAVDTLLQDNRQQLACLHEAAQASRLRQTEAAARYHELAKEDVLARQAELSAREHESSTKSIWLTGLESSPFADEEETAAALLNPGEADGYAERVRNYHDSERELEIGLKELDAKLENRTVTENEWQAAAEALAAAKEQDEAALQQSARSERDLEDLETRHIRWQELECVRTSLERESDLLAKLQSALRGNAFVEYVAEEQLRSVSHAASQRLRYLTKQRYSLETDSGGGFVICDDANGGVKRPVATLSGGETFLTSLALALALSAQIQLRGRYPLQFFFLDEGFGTLDPELLDTVITSLEHLYHDHLSVGIISHVAELRSRLARKLVVIPAESGGAGSRVVIERM